MAGDASWNSSVANIEQPILLREHLDEIANEVCFPVISNRSKISNIANTFVC